MKNENDIKNEKVRHYFPGGNSSNGFVSFYNNILRSTSVGKLGIIKGGPGTGKSSFMRRVAAYAEEKGRRVEYFRCSSDPHSLDGIIVDGCVAVLDGTAPHAYEPSLVGVKDEIINLGEFWDTDRLCVHYNDISALSSRRSLAYFKVYRFLSAVSNLDGINDRLVLDALDREKVHAAVLRILRQVRSGQRFSMEYGFVNAIGMSGLTHISSYEKKAKRLYLIYDSYGLGWHFLSELLDCAMEKKVRVQVSYDPLSPQKPDGVYFPDDGIALVICYGEGIEGAVRVNMSRFIKSEALSGKKSEYRYNKRLRDSLLTAAVDALSEAGRYHFEIEDIYKSCMDFEAESRFIEDFCRAHF